MTTETETLEQKHRHWKTHGHTKTYTARHTVSQRHTSRDTLTLTLIHVHTAGLNLNSLWFHERYEAFTVYSRSRLEYLSGLRICSQVSRTISRMDGWLRFNGILSTQVAAISCLSHIASVFWVSYVAFTIRCLSQSSSLSLLRCCWWSLTSPAGIPSFQLDRLQAVMNVFRPVDKTTSRHCSTVCIGFMRITYKPALLVYMYERVHDQLK